MKNTEQLFYDLLEAKTTKEVDEVLNKFGLSDRENFKPLNGVGNSISTLYNSKSEASQALTEKLTNSVDAIIERDVLKSENIPNSFQDAVDNFSEKSKKENSTKKQDCIIKLIAKGNKTNPTMVVIDNGVGQDFSTFESTFLTMSNSNKINKFYLTGSYNTGSFNIVKHLSGGRYQLIISKKPNELMDNNLFNDVWTFTLLKMFDPLPNMKLEEYMFLMIDGKLPFFKNKKGINVIPDDDKTKTNGVFLKNGTLIQMYECNLIGYNSIITSDLKYRLNWMYPDTPFKIDLLERRSLEFKKSHSHNATLIGSHYELKNKLDDDQVIFNKNGILEYSKYKIPYDIYVIKTTNKKNPDRKKRGDIGVFFTINGQTQATKSNNIFKDLGFTYLKNNIIVFIDYSSIEPNNIYKHISTDRSSLEKDSDLNKIIINMISYELKSNKEIKNLETEERNVNISSNEDINLDYINNLAVKCFDELILNEHTLSRNENGKKSGIFSDNVKDNPKKSGGKKSSPKINKQGNKYLTIGEFKNICKNFSTKESSRNLYKDCTTHIHLVSKDILDIKILVDDKEIDVNKNNNLNGSFILHINISGENHFRSNKISNIKIIFSYINKKHKDIIVEYWINVKEKSNKSNLKQTTRTNHTKIVDGINVILNSSEELKNKFSNDFNIDENCSIIPIINEEDRRYDLYFNTDNISYIKYCDKEEMKTDGMSIKIKNILYLAIKVEFMKIYDKYHVYKSRYEKNIMTSTEKRISMEAIINRNTIEEEIYKHFIIEQSDIINRYKEYLK